MPKMQRNAYTVCISESLYNPVLKVSSLRCARNAGKILERTGTEIFEKSVLTRMEQFFTQALNFRQLAQSCYHSPRSAFL